MHTNILPCQQLDGCVNTPLCKNRILEQRSLHINTTERAQSMQTLCNNLFHSHKEDKDVVLKITLKFAHYVGVTMYFPINTFGFFLRRELQDSKRLLLLYTRFFFFFGATESSPSEPRFQPWFCSQLLRP